MNIEGFLNRMKKFVNHPYLYGIVFNFAVIISFLVSFGMVGESNFGLVTLLMFIFGVLGIAYSVALITFDGENDKRFGLYIFIFGFILVLLGAINYNIGFIGALLGFFGIMLLGMGRKEIEEKMWYEISSIGLLLVAIGPVIGALYIKSLPIVMSILGIILYIIGGIFILLKESTYRGKMYAIFVLAFISYAMIVVIPMHEAVGMHANRTYGIFDSSMGFLSFVTFIISFLLYIYLFYSEKSKYEAEKKKALKAISKGEYELAIKHFDRMLSYQNTVEAYNGKAICLLNMGRIDEAKKVLREALSFYPDEPSILTNIGNLLMHKDDIDGAIKLYKRALKIDQKYIHAWNNLGRAYMLKGRFEEAKKCFNNAKVINPESEVAKMNMAELEELSRTPLEI